MTTTVFIVNGKPLAGKDTLIDFMYEHLESIGIPVRAFSSIDPVRDVLINMHIDVSLKTDRDRKLLSVVGDAVEEHSCYRTDKCKMHIIWVNDTFKKHPTKVAFLHIREPHLIEKIIKDLSQETVKFVKVMVESNRSKNVTSNKSDAGVDAMEYDVLVNNDEDLNSLHDKALRLLDMYEVI